MKSVSYLTSKIICSFIILFIALFFFINSNENIFSQNSLTVSDILIDFSTFETEIQGYTDDYESSNPIKTLEAEKDDVSKFGDSCRMEIIDEPEKFQSRNFKEAGDCDIRINNEKKLPFTAIWKDMQFPMWIGFFKGRDEKLNFTHTPLISSQLIQKDTPIKIDGKHAIVISEDTRFIKIQVHYPISQLPYEVIIKPKFPIYEYDLDGMPINRVKKIDISGSIENNVNTGIIDNIGQIKDIELNIIGLNASNRIYIVLSDQSGNLTKYFMGWLYTEFSDKPMKWSNSDYVIEEANYIINPIPTNPREIKYVKFHSLVIEYDHRNMGGNSVFLIKDIKLIYDYQIAAKKLSFDIQSEDFWENLIKIGKEKRELYEKYAQPIIEKDLEKCYFSPDRQKDCKYSLNW